MKGCSAMRRTSPIKSDTTPSTCTEQSVWGSSRECRSSDGWPLPCVVDLCRSHSCWKWSCAILETLRLSSCSHPKVLLSWNPRGEPSSSSERRKKKRKEKFSCLNLTPLYLRICSLLGVIVKLVPHYVLLLFTQVFTFKSRLGIPFSFF